MHTNDEVTRRFFKNSSVQVLLCPRSARKGHSWLKQTVRIRALKLLWTPLYFLNLDATFEMSSAT